MIQCLKEPRILYFFLNLCNKPIIQEHSFTTKISYFLRIYHECEGRIEKSVLLVTVCHHSASLVMPNGDPQDGLFYHTLTRIIDSFSC